jgi:P27 family predicted phage terminase small subunit
MVRSSLEVEEKKSMKTDKQIIGDIECPDNIGIYGEREFGRIKGELIKMGYLSVDKAILDSYLTSYHYFCLAKKHIQDHGMMITTPKGQLQINPWHSVMRQHQEILKKCMSELGFSAGSRKRLQLELDQNDTDDDLFGV